MTSWLKMIQKLDEIEKKLEELHSRISITEKIIDENNEIVLKKKK